MTKSYLFSGLYLHLRHPNLIERIVCLDSINFITVEPDIFFEYVEYYYDDFYDSKKYPIFNAITPSPTYTYEQVINYLYDLERN